MTKREEALNKLWNAIEEKHDEIPKELETAYDIVYKTVRNYGKYKKYRKPMPVSKNGIYAAAAYCPRCGEYVGNSYTNYCRDCGQALSWGDE